MQITIGSSAAMAVAAAMLFTSGIAGVSVAADTATVKCTGDELLQGNVRVQVREEQLQRQNSCKGRAGCRCRRPTATPPRPRRVRSKLIRLSMSAGRRCAPVFRLAHRTACLLHPCRSTGFGLGLRPSHYEAMLNEPHPIDWLEVITENYLVPGGKPLHLSRARSRALPAGHARRVAVDRQHRSRSTGSTSRRYAPGGAHRARWISDHLCWTGVEGRNVHDLLPLPYTEEALARSSRAWARCRRRSGGDPARERLELS